MYFSLIAHRSLILTFLIAILSITVCASLNPPPLFPFNPDTIHSGIECPNNIACHGHSTCFKHECVCNLNFKWNRSVTECRKITCTQDYDCVVPGLVCQLPFTNQSSCGCRNGYDWDQTNMECAPQTKSNSSGPWMTILTPLGGGILIAAIIIGVWRILHRRKMRRWAEMLKTRPVQLPVGSYPTMASTPSTSVVSPTPTPPGGFHYPAPQMPIGAYPHSEGPLSPMAFQQQQQPMQPQPLPHQHYGSMSYTQQPDFPPPYSPSNPMDMAGCSSRPDTLNINSNHLTVANGAPTPSNPYSPLSSSKLTLL